MLTALGLQRFGSTVPLLLSAVAASLGLTAPPHARAADAPVPATVADAIRAIDLRTVKLAEGASPPGQQTAAQLTYQAPGSVATLFEFHKRQLVDQHWLELPQGYVSDQAASGSFQRNGFTLSLSVSSSSTGDEGKALVVLLNHGNVDTQKLPVPAGCRLLFAGPVSAMYLSDAAIEPTAAEVSKLLREQGWRPYGIAGETMFFKQNAIRIGARVAKAPAQQGKTVIEFFSEQMSADLPAPDVFERLQYADSTTQLSFDTVLSPAQVVDFYRRQLATAKWQSTTQNPVKRGLYDTLIFRNSDHEMLTLETFTVDGKVRVTLRQQTAPQVAELDRRAREEPAAGKTSTADQPFVPKLPLALPAGAEKIKQSGTTLSFKTASGKGRVAVAELRKALRAAGWKEDQNMLETKHGVVTLSNGDQQLVVVYVDPGIISAEISITGTAVDPEVGSVGRQ